MLPFFVILILACFISFIIIKIYTLISLKNQTENFKSASNIYMTKKMDVLSKLIQEIRLNIGETDDIINIIKLRNEFNQVDSINKNMDIIHNINKAVGTIYANNPSLLNIAELANLKNELYSIDANLRENSSLYIEAATNYNDMLDDVFCAPIVKLFNYTEEEI